jgi:RNA polymerase sigma-70 factor (ECF subfamily)
MMGTDKVRKLQHPHRRPRRSLIGRVGDGSVSIEEQKTILERVAAGDQAAVQACIDAYGNLIWSLARRFLRNDADAEDAVQDVFIELWSSAGRFDRRVASETAFVSTVARRRLIDRLRQQTRRPGMDSIDDEEFGELRHPSVPAEQEQATEVEVVRRVLGTMDPEQRQIIMLSLYEGYSHSEIADELSLPLGTVKTRIRRGLIYVRDQLNVVAGTAEEAAG